MNDSELIKGLRWMARVRICETKIVNCHECEFTGYCTDPDSEESIANQIVVHEQAATRIEQLKSELAASQRREQAAAQDLKDAEISIESALTLLTPRSDGSISASSARQILFDYGKVISETIDGVKTMVVIRRDPKEEQCFEEESHDE